MNKVLPLMMMAATLTACGQSQPSETVDYLVAHPDRIKELQHIRVFDGIARSDGILGLRHRALGQHRRFVFRQRRALIELAADLPVKLAHAPAATQRLDFVEPAGMVVLDCQSASNSFQVSASKFFQLLRLI